MSSLIIPDKKLILLDHTRMSPTEADFYEFARTRFVGQRRILEYFAHVLEALFQEFYPAKGPMGSVLLVGPSGVGKTLAAQLLSWYLFGDPEGFSRIDGQDMSLRENVARLIGASPGYVGYDDPPMITQRSLDEPAFRCILRYSLAQASEEVRQAYSKIQQERDEIIEYITGLGKTDKKEMEAAQDRLAALMKRMKEIGVPVYDRRKYVFPSVLLLDEIEKGCPAYHNLLFRLIDEGKLPIVSKSQNMGSYVLDFRKTIIIATCNLGEEDLKKFFRELSGRATGYHFVNRTLTNDEIALATYRICREAVDKFFPTPFVNRFGDVIAAQLHSREELLRIVDIELNKFRERLLDPAGFNFPISLHVHPLVKEYLADKISDSPEKGMRFLEQKLKKRLERAIVTLKATEQAEKGDVLYVSFDQSSKEFVFHKEDRYCSREELPQ